MPQGPIAVSNANLVTQGAKNSLNITAARVVKAGPGTLLAVTVIVAGSAAGTINDLAANSGVAAANQVYTIPNAAGTYQIGFPCLTGIVVTPGTGQTLAVSYI